MKPERNIEEVFFLIFLYPLSPLEEGDGFKKLTIIYICRWQVGQPGSGSRMGWGWRKEYEHEQNQYNLYWKLLGAYWGMSFWLLLTVGYDWGGFSIPNALKEQSEKQKKYIFIIIFLASLLEKLDL